MPVTLAKDIAGEEIVISAADGVEIAGNFLVGKGTKACVLVLHGNGANRAGLSKVISMFHTAGHGVFAIDFRGHGNSAAVRTTAGFDERLDADAAFSIMKQKCVDRKLAIYGFSLGGAAALLGKAAQSADAVILDSVYTDIESAVSVRIKMNLGRLGDYIVTPALMRALELRTGLRREQMRPVDGAMKIKSPTLLLAGELDLRAPASGMRTMQSKIRAPTRFIFVPNADHGENAAQLGTKFDRTLLEFLDQIN